MRTIAAAVELSAMTVSLALRNHPRIPEMTRERVRKTAAKLGYRPDPQVAKLMHHLRTGRKPGFQAAIAALTTVTEGKETAYMDAIVRSARLRAEQLGYGFTLFRIQDPPKAEPALQRMLRSRGVEGIVLLPITTPRDMTQVLDWNTFAVVTTTYGVLAPQFHRIVPHQFGNALEICRQLAQLGYRRIGLVLPAEQDVRVHHGFSAAVAWQSIIGGTEFVRPLIHAGDLPNRVEARAWFKAEMPDVVIASGDVTAKPIVDLLGLRIPGSVGFVSASKADRSIFAGVDEHPEEIGATAIEQLAAMIQRGEIGRPRLPKVTMVDGEWLANRSVGKVRAKTKARS